MAAMTARYATQGLARRQPTAEPSSFQCATDPSSSPEPCRTGSEPWVQAPPISNAAVHGSTASSKLQRAPARRAPRWRDLLHAPRGADRHRELAPPLQSRPAACLNRLPCSCPRGVRPGTRRIAGSATPTSSAGQAPAGAQTSPKLTLRPDHSVGAGHPGLSTRTAQVWPS